MTDEEENGLAVWREQRRISFWLGVGEALLILALAAVAWWLLT